MSITWTLNRSVISIVVITGWLVQFMTVEKNSSQVATGGIVQVGMLVHDGDEDDDNANDECVIELLSIY